MCGIAGFFGQRMVSPAATEHMMTELRRRGPDAQHIVGWDAAFQPSHAPPFNALLHARLSIIDPRPEADQPMSNESGDVWICYNGEVYDWQADAEALRKQGVHFRTRSDTEFILRAYETWGLDCLPKLRGMFALAILDLRTRKLHLIRDRLGLKPLVYYHDAGEFAFASTVRALLPYVPADQRGFSADGIDAYLAHRYIPAPRTVFQRLSRLENAHYLTFDLVTRALHKQRYWHPEPVAADWREMLDHAIKIRTVADRPLGLFLSGGIDSTVLASRLSTLGFNNLHSYTAAFPGSRLDESEHASAAARALGLPNHAIPVPTRIGEDFGRIVADLDEPFADPSSFPLWYLARETTQHVKVVLGGDGGDELFAGYKRVHKHLRSAWRRGWRLPVGKAMASAHNKGFAKLCSEAGMSWEEAYSLRFSGFTPNQRRYLQPDLGFAQPNYWRPTVAHRDPLEALLAIDFDNYLPEYILRKGDLCTMAHGLELRAPLLDHHWVSAVLAVPHAERFTQPPKRMLEAVCPPCSQLDLFNQKKRGFNPPLQTWLRDDLADRLTNLAGRLAIVSGHQVDRVSIERLVTSDGPSDEQMLQLLVLDESLAQLSHAAAHV